MYTIKIFLSIYLLISFSLNISGASNESVYVKIDDLKIIGKHNKLFGVEEYLGIPFAQPPIDDLRWEKPVPWVSKKKNINAKNFKPACMQTPSIVNWYKRLVETFGYDPDTFASPEFSEDCLYLNIWRPSNSKRNLPVIVYIHGGSNEAGWSYEPNYRGYNIANKDVILVSIPYRLGIFGYFSHPKMQHNNLALYDQVLALNWIQDYITNFGGDPSNVTIMGESAGAMSIEYLMVSPLSKNTFSKAIHQSGGVPLIYPTLKADAQNQAIKFEKYFFNEYTDNVLTELKKIDSNEILKAVEEVYSEEFFDFVVDGITIIEPLMESFKKGNIHSVDLIIGANNDEWSLYHDDNVDVNKWLDEETTPEQKEKLLNLFKDIDDPLRKMDLLLTSQSYVCPSLIIAKSVKNKNRQAWVYQFNRVRDNDLAKTFGAYHGAELPYVFNTHDEWLPTNKKDIDLTDDIQDYWISFARYGNPNSDRTSEWLPYDAKNKYTQILDVKSYSVEHPSQKICEIMQIY